MQNRVKEKQRQEKFHPWRRRAAKLDARKHEERKSESECYYGDPTFSSFYPRIDFNLLGTTDVEVAPHYTASRTVRLCACARFLML